MIQEELLMRRNRYRSREQRESDELIEKIEIKEPEFAKRVSVFLFYRFLSYYSQCITFNRLIFDYFFSDRWKMNEIIFKKPFRHVNWRFII